MLHAVLVADHCVLRVELDEAELAVERLLLALARVRRRLSHTTARHRVLVHGEGGGEPVRGHLPRRNVVHVATEVVLAATAAAEAVVGPDTVVVARLTLELRLYPEKLNLRVGIAILH